MKRQTRVSEVREFDFAILTPSGAPDPGLAIAGSRAGDLGVLNLEFASDPEVALDALRKLVHLSQGRCGVLLEANAEALLASILADLSGPQPEILFLAAPQAHADYETAERMIRAVRESGRRAYLVASSVEDVRFGIATGVDALVAKGSEAGGWVGEETTLVLLQRVLNQTDLPVLVQGGLGLHTTAACFAVGAAGAVLDSQLLLARESPLGTSARARLSTFDGSETVCLGTSLANRFRAYSRSDLTPADDLRRFETNVGLLQPDDLERRRLLWRSAVRERVDWTSPEQSVWAIGQDAAFAHGLAERFVTVSGIISGLREAIREHCAIAQQARPLMQDGALAQSHGTRYPIVQGPMTRVSDRADFALAVAESGALPFVALALLRGPEVKALLEETRAKLDSRPWGVGILGFVPPELRSEQLEAIREIRPPFALIAGGRPDQARQLEADGTPTYLHVPSPGLLRMFLKDSARRFVFEGRECGGHVGPRTSFVLWETMINVLLENLPSGRPADDFHVLFAGGIHDARSAAMVSVMAAPLVERGVRIGVLMGSAYVFTTEAVRSGAITSGFQKVAVACDRTTLLQTGPGHATRCAPSPFTEEFERERLSLVQAGLPHEEVRGQLELLNIGRLRIASKGVDRDPRYGQDGAASKLLSLSDEDQQTRGMFMLGQVAALRDRTCTIDELHQDVSLGGSQLLQELGESPAADDVAPLPPAAVAIVGVGTIMPGAADARVLWDNILGKVDAITEVPADRWDWRRYYDPDRAAPDKIYSRWGGFIDEIPFDPVTFGMPPSSLRSIEPFQLLALAVVRAALHDAGYERRPFPRERTSVVLGAGGGGGDLTGGYVVRSSLPSHFGDSAGALTDQLDLPEWTEDSFAGILMNVAAGRIANRFDFGGVNYTVDAACASSLAAVYLAVRDLQAHTSDVVIAGGVDSIQNPFAFLCFSKTQALSPSGRCRPFDAEADGIAISEGFAALVLKRVEDAERDGDRIYAVIRGVGGASDGRDRSLTAPRPEGQMRALRRAYEHAGFSAATVELVEAHGTGTVAGDQAEAAALTTFFKASGAQTQGTALGSIKSMIGHTKASAGVASLTKVALALHHRVLPATLGVKEPNPKANFAASPFYINAESRPWIHAQSAYPRRAGVSAFGFGGTDFHVVLEEYTGSFVPPAEATMDRWPAELLVWRGEPQHIERAIGVLLQQLDRGAQPQLADLAYTLSLAAMRGDRVRPTLAVVATSLEDLSAKLRLAIPQLRHQSSHYHDAQGIHYSAKPLGAHGKIAFLFPGQGSQYVNMARELAMLFPEAREAFERADRAIDGRLPRRLSDYIFPAPAFSAEEERRQQAALTDTHVAQPALGATDLALLHVLDTLGVTADMVAGHSYGEFVALCAAGAFDETTLLQISEARGRFILEAAAQDSGAMAAVDGSAEQLAELAAECGVTLANLNGPQQTVISGATPNIQRAIEWCERHQINARKLAVACAFHSPLVAPAEHRLAEYLADVKLATPRIPVFSNTTATPYPAEPEAITSLLSQHLAKPVDFMSEVLAMYESGASIFVEVGPRTVMSGLVGRILGDRPHVCASLDQPARPGVSQLLHALAALITEGVAVNADRLFRGRTVRSLDLTALADEARVQYTPTTWMVNGGRARPLHEPVLITAPVEVQVANSDTPSTPEVPEPHRAAATAPLATATPLESHTLDDPPMTSPPQLAPILNGYATEQRQAVGYSTSGVMHDFQAVMQRFLETQRNVMLAYLGAAGAIELPALSGYELASPELSSPAAHLLLPQGWSETLAVEPLANGHTNGKSAATGTNGTQAAGTHVAVSETPSRSAPPPASANGVTHTPAAPIMPAPITVTLDREHVTRELLKTVSDRTGYPPEMLTLDADLEADLGIDSIKRVEIAGTLLQSLDLPPGVQPDIERLTAARSLGQVVETLLSGLAPPEAVGLSGPHDALEGSAHSPFELDGPAPARIGRFVPHTVSAPTLDTLGRLSTAGCVVIIDDENGGVGRQLAERLDSNGLRVTRVQATTLDEPGSVQSFVEAVRADFGEVSALVHLAGLRPGAAEAARDTDGWRNRFDTNLRSLFLLAQAFQPDLERSARSGGAAVLSASSLGGAFGIHHVADDLFPGDGAAAGFMKSLAQEWPSVRMKSVDLEVASAECRAAWLHAELLTSDGCVEVGYCEGQRVIVEPRPSPAQAPDIGSLDLEPEAVVLVTGGARGITAEVAAWLAERYRPTLLLVGRTPEPSAPESPETAQLTEPEALRRALIALQRAAGHTPTPAAIERACTQLLHEREVRQNLARMRQSGGVVEYLTCDVADAAAFSTLIDEVYARHGRIDGVIHGAGVIEDRLVRDKHIESFTRVVDTKVESSRVLADKLRQPGLRFLVFFSSVSARFGNRGQTDYAAAGEVLNKMAQSLHVRWPGTHVVSLNWGPWLKTGMVSHEVLQQFAERGIEAIPPRLGCQLLESELRRGRTDDVEVVIGGLTRLASSTVEHLPLLASQTRLFRPSPGTLEAVRVLDPAHDVYLDDHRLDGRPVLPFAMAMELMAEVGAALHPDLEVRSVVEQRVLQGIVVGEPLSVRVVAASRPQAVDGTRQFVEVEILSVGQRARRHYTATVELDSGRSDAAPEGGIANTALLHGTPFPMSVAEAYRTWLFHGPRFQGILTIEAIGPFGARAILRRSAVADNLRPGRGGDWLIDPIMVDCGFQMQVLWARLHWGITLLPARVGRSERRLQPSRTPRVLPDTLQYELRIRPESRQPTCHADHVFSTPDGTVVAMLSDVEGIGSQALNRLAGSEVAANA